VGQAAIAGKKAGEMCHVAAVQLVLFAQAQQLLLVLHRAKRAFWSNVPNATAA
jgi:hypothetical protein